jgi:hypothetical protein
LARLAFPFAVLLPRVPRVVEAVAVDLDGRAVLGPAAVDALGAGGAVGDGEREAGLLEPAEEALPELGEGDGDVAVQDGGEVCGALRLAFGDRHDLRGRGPVANPGLVAGPSEVIEGEVGGQVDEGLGVVTGIAQHRSLTARPNRGEVARFDAGRTVADAINPPVLREQRTDGDALLDLG